MMMKTQPELKLTSPILHAIQPRDPVSLSTRRTALPHQLWLHIHLPQFALEILTRGDPSERASVLVAGQGRNVQIISANRGASALGVRVGMSLGAAQILGELMVFTRDERLEKQALERLCAWAYQFTPVISPVPPDGLLLEIKGSLRLFDGVDGLLKRVRRGLRELGYRTSLAVAPTPLAASVLARAETQRIIFAKEELAGALAALPLEPLRLADKQIEVLSSIGVRSIGDCQRLPHAGLARRTTPKLLEAFQRLMGQAPDPRPRFELPRLFQSRIEIPWETRNAQVLCLAGERLIHEFVGYLRSANAATRQLRWSLYHANGHAKQVSMALTSPSRDHAHFALLLRERLNRLQIEENVVGLSLYADDIQREQATPGRDLFDARTAAETEDWASFLDRLRARLGDQTVRGLRQVADHRPECAWRWTKLSAPHAREKCAVDARAAANLPERPLWLMRRPIRLQTRAGSLELNGPLRLLQERERIETGWWDGKPIGRDYFIALNPSGARLWIYRELRGQQHWYLHGIFE